MERKETKYGLRLKGSNKILQYSSYSLGERDFSVDRAYSLEKDGDGDWLVDTRDYALYVMFNQTEEYNASYDTPQHGYLPEELEIVIVETTIKEIPIEDKFIKVKLKKEYENECDLPCRDKYTKFAKETRYIIGKTGTAINKGEEIELVYVPDCWFGIGQTYYFDKKYFDIIEE